MGHGRLNLVLYPPEDRDLAAFVGALVEADPRASYRPADVVEALLARLRERYPEADIRVKDALAEMPGDDTTWYVFRDGRIVTPDEPADGEAPGPADRA